QRLLPAWVPVNAKNCGRVGEHTLPAPPDVSMSECRGMNDPQATLRFRVVSGAERVSEAQTRYSGMTLSSNCHPARTCSWSMIFSENGCPPRIKSGAGFFGIML